MNSEKVRTIGDSNQPETQHKKLWTKPSVEKITLESAEYGGHQGNFDSMGSSARNRS